MKNSLSALDLDGQKGIMTVKINLLKSNAFLACDLWIIV
jgi:hypothetical protein